MSYDIFFYGTSSDKVTPENIDDLVESGEFYKDEHLISKETMHEIKDVLLEKGLKFESFFDNKVGIELGLRFASYFVHMYPGEIAISIPYHKENSEESVEAEINLISETIVGKGLLGYDPQTGELITEKDGLRLNFSFQQAAIDDHISQIYPQTDGAGKSSAHLGDSFWWRILLDFRQMAVELAISAVAIFLIVILLLYLLPLFK